MASTLDIIISEVTKLESRIGVAGWSAEQGRMIRPILISNDIRWPADMAGPELMAVGNIVRFAPTGILTGRPHPYTTEDVVVEPRPRWVGRLEGSALIEALRPSEGASIGAIFGEHLLEGAYVSVGDRCPSLAAISTWAGHTLSFDEWERDGQPRLRCVFTDGAGVRHSLSVVSRHLSEVHRLDGLDGLTDLSRRHRCAHVRLGLELPDEQGRAYLRVNDILFY